MAMVLAKTDLAIASRYADDRDAGRRDLRRIAAARSSIRHLQAITGNVDLLYDNPRRAQHQNRSRTSSAQSPGRAAAPFAAWADRRAYAGRYI
jgi:phosphoenolpyruvate carboxylase